MSRHMAPLCMKRILPLAASATVTSLIGQGTEWTGHSLRPVLGHTWQWFGKKRVGVVSSLPSTGNGRFEGKDDWAGPIWDNGSVEVIYVCVYGSGGLLSGSKSRTRNSSSSVICKN